MFLVLTFLIRLENIFWVYRSADHKFSLFPFMETVYLTFLLFGLGDQTPRKIFSLEMEFWGEILFFQHSKNVPLLPDFMVSEGNLLSFKLLFLFRYSSPPFPQGVHSKMECLKPWTVPDITCTMIFAAHTCLQ